MRTCGNANRLRLAVLLTAGLWASAVLADPGYSSDPTAVGARDIAGAWQREAYEPALRPADGSPLPFTPEGRAQFEKNAKDLKRQDRALTRCVPLGNPRNLVSPYPFLVVQTPGRVAALFERNRGYQVRYLDAQHNDTKIWDPSFTGDAVAKWDGDTLVTDITNTNGESWIDDSGVPTSDQLHLVERWRKAADGRLLVTVTVEDPVIFTRPWSSGELVYRPRPDVQVQADWVCDEPHRSVADVPGAARYFPDPRPARK